MRKAVRYIRSEVGLQAVICISLPLSLPFSSPLLPSPRISLLNPPPPLSFSFTDIILTPIPSFISRYPSPSSCSSPAPYYALPSIFLLPPFPPFLLSSSFLLFPPLPSPRASPTPPLEMPPPSRVAQLRRLEHSHSHVNLSRDFTQSHQPLPFSLPPLLCHPFFLHFYLFFFFN